MKYALMLAFTLFACAHGVDDPLPQTSKEEPSPPLRPNIDEDPSSDGDTLPCDRREVVTFVVDGKTIVFMVPSLCDPTPYIEKGDPPPWNQAIDLSTPTSR